MQRTQKETERGRASIDVIADRQRDNCTQERWTQDLLLLVCLFQRLLRSRIPSYPTFMRKILRTFSSFSLFVPCTTCSETGNVAQTFGKKERKQTRTHSLVFRFPRRSFIFVLDVLAEITEQNALSVEFASTLIVRPLSKTREIFTVRWDIYFYVRFFLRALVLNDQTSINCVSF